MMRYVVLAATLVLAACAGTPNWTKKGVSPEVTSRELADCRNIAREATRRDTNITTDIMASRGNDWQRTGVMDYQLRSLTLGDTVRSDDIVKRCMIGKGFAPAQ